VNKEVEIALMIYAVEFDSSKWIALKMFARELDNS
jgi:hypothetical protein